MSKVLHFLILPSEVSEFERAYLARVNKFSLVFFALHVPVFAAIALVNDTRPVLAVLLALAVLCGPLLARSALRNPRHVSVIHGVSAMFMGGLLVHFGQGPVQIEMHFYFFALLAMCAVFGNPLVVVAATVTVALHHLVVWLVLPQSVFNYEAQWWVVAVHALFVVLEAIATCFIARSFFDNVIGLEKIVRARTSELDSKNPDMRLLLDNVHQGFLTIDVQGRLARERSACVDLWFGAPASGATWFEYLAAVSPAFAERTRFGWEQVAEGFLPLEVTLAQMPAALTKDGAHYRVEYRPIGGAVPHENYLVIVTDVTTDVAREVAEVERRETLALFERVLNDRAGVEDFVEDGGSALGVVTRPRAQDATLVKRLLHTLKGNAAIFGLSSIAAQCHELEDSIAETGELPRPEAYASLLERWKRLEADVDRLVGSHSQSTEIDDEQYAALEAAARAGESGRALLMRVRGLKFEAASKRLKHFADQAARIAERLDKDLRIQVEDHGVRLDRRRWGRFWGAFVHALRNSVDHGIESREERAAAGKPAQGTIALRTLEDRDRFLVEIADDGRGIDWKCIAERAKGAGLPAETPLDLERALFTEGITTAEDVTDLSGRGVGMGALLAATEELGGKLSIDTTVHEGTTLRFSFPVREIRPVDSFFPARAAS